MFDSYAEIFAERGAAYHAAMAAFPRARDAEFDAVLEPLRGLPEGLLCDMPSGSGYLAAHLRAGMRYVGVDPSDDFIGACPSEIERIKAAITSVPLPDASIDYVVSLAALHHEPDLSAGFLEMRRLLKPGGRAVIADVAVGSSPARFLNGFVDANNPMGHEGHFLDEHTRGLLEQAGFVIADDASMSMPWRFESVADAGLFCRQLFWMPKLSSGEVASAMDEEIGFDVIDGLPHLRWALRRIVCNAA